MKKPSGNRKITAAKIIAGLAATAALGAGISGCIDPADNSNPEVYGPPEDYTAVSSEPVESSEETTEETTKVTTAPSESTFDPHDNEVPAVYGPPEDFDPSANEPVAVYGPPEDMIEDSSDSDSVVEYETSEAHDPGKN